MAQNNSNVANSVLAFVLLLASITVVVVTNKITAPSVLIDEDADGYYTISVESKQSDCNDKDATIYPDAPETPGDGIDQNCDKTDQLPEFDPSDYLGDDSQFNQFTDLKNQGKYIEIYNSLVTPEVVTTNDIVALSRRIRTYGEFDNAYLFVSAGSGDDGKLKDGESVYFYIDTGDSGGHLIKAKTLLIPEEKVDTTHSTFLYGAANLVLTSIPYEDENTPVIRTLNLLDVLNDENHGYDRKHYLGAFVSSSRADPTLYELGIAYSCVELSDCGIEIIK